MMASDECSPILPATALLSEYLKKSEAEKSSRRRRV